MEALCTVCAGGTAMASLVKLDIRVTFHFTIHGGLERVLMRCFPSRARRSEIADERLSLSGVHSIG